MRGSSTVGMLYKANMTKPHLLGWVSLSLFLVTFTLLLLWISHFLFFPLPILLNFFIFSPFFTISHPFFKTSVLFYFLSFPQLLLQASCFHFVFSSLHLFFLLLFSSHFVVPFFLSLCVCCCQSTAVCLGPWGDTVQVFLILSQGKDASDSDWCVIPAQTHTHLDVQHAKACMHAFSRQVQWKCSQWEWMACRKWNQRKEIILSGTI